MLPKNKNSKSCLLKISVLTCLGFANIGSTQAGQAHKKDNTKDSNDVLDELDHSLRNQAPPVKSLPKTTKHKNSTTHIQASSGKDELVELTQQIDQLANQVQSLQAEIKQRQTKIQLDTHWDSVVKVVVKLEKSSTAIQLQTLQLRIDGQSVYALEPLHSAWLPQDSFVAYYGPLAPGEHHVDLSCKVALLTATDLPLASDAFKSLDQSFDLTVPLGAFRRVWTVTLGSPQSVDKPLHAKIEVGELKEEERQARW